MSPLSRPMRALVTLATLTASFTVCPTGALAHAYVSATSPGINATVASSPSEISVTFDEAVAVESPDALVTWPVGGTNAACVGGPQVDAQNPRRIVCRLAKPLRKGAYIVSWRVTSDDTHVVHGVFSFGVGVAVQGEHGETPTPYDPSGVLATLLRWLSLAGASTLAGALAFERLVLRTQGAGASESVALELLRHRAQTIARAGTIAALAGSCGALDVQAAAATGSSWLDALPHLGSVVVRSLWGMAWAVRVVALLAAAALAWRGRAPAVAAALAFLALLTFSLSGHAVATDQTFQLGLRAFADWLHLSSAALWSGGVLVLAAGIRPALKLLASAERAGFARGLISRFSGLAIAAVSAIVVTGIYASAVQVHSWPDLFGTTYGRIVLAKIALLAPLLGIGYGHYRQGKGAAPRFDFASGVLLEAGLVLAVIGLSATLSGLAPPFPKPVQMEE